MNSDIYMNQTPYEIFASKLDAGEYLCSVRTMYRILKDNDQVRERRNIKRSNNYQKPELLATKPKMKNLPKTVWINKPDNIEK